MLFYEQARTEGENWTGISATKDYNGTKGEEGFTSLQWQLGHSRMLESEIAMICIGMITPGEDAEEKDCRAKGT